MKNAINIEIPDGYEIDEVKFKKIDQDITKQITSLNSALEYLGENDFTVKRYRSAEKDLPYSKGVDFYALACIIRALNERQNLKINDEYTSKCHVTRKLDSLSPCEQNIEQMNIAVPMCLCFKNKKLAQAFLCNMEFYSRYRSYLE